MKKALVVIACLWAGVAAYAQGASGGEKTLSPYFVVGKGPEIDRFPLLANRVNAEISGVIASVELTQVYKNEGSKTLEAVYVFPLGTKAAIHALRMEIGDRVIEADIKERDAARQIYEQAKDSGKAATLLEQQRPNVFQMNVANIMPGDVVEVTVEYTELIVPEEGVYEFVYPTVVGPRYTGETTGDGKHDQWTATPYLPEGSRVPYAYTMQVHLSGGVPLQKVWVPSHRVKVTKDDSSAEITLSPEEYMGGNRDFRLKYTLAGERIQTGLLLFPGEEENYFLYMAQPPERVPDREIVPREYVFLVDVSGSMRGFPLQVSKKLVRGMLEQLSPGEQFNIVFFAGGSQVLSERSIPATKENLDRALRMLDEQRGGGGTRILDALNRLYSLESEEGVARSIIAVTDGYVSVEKRVFDSIRDHAGEANFFAFGIGRAVNRYLIEGMARAGSGEPCVVTSQEDAEQNAARFLRYVSSPVLTDIKVRFAGFDAYDVEPPAVPDLFAERPIVVYGKYRRAGGSILLSGQTAQGSYEQRTEVTPGMESADHQALRLLWARERIARLGDYSRVGAEVKQEITELGLTYSLMTAYTSFVAVDSLVRDTGETVTVKQPLPLPEGVPATAVGSIMPQSRGMNFCVKAPALSADRAMNERKEMVTSPPRQTTDEEGKPQPGASRRVVLAGGSYPGGIQESEVEKMIASQADALGRLFAQWKLERIRLALSFVQGRLTRLTVRAHEGRDYDAGALRNILEKTTLSPGLTGNMEVTLELK
ncbi:MAG: VWA domain-containing protein [Candidatus Omnitrophica bacterium]|nr:VWA domain-containing protein [Candidatus Omnitrophota bacterium]